MAGRRGPKDPISSEHKAALAQGRSEGRAIREYLDALQAIKPKRGRRRTSESISRRLAAIDERLPSVDPLGKLLLIQERRDLTDELSAMGAAVDLAALEDAFVKAAPGYGQRHGISYAAWREVGVTPAVLKRAGIARRA